MVFNQFVQRAGLFGTLATSLLFLSACGGSAKPPMSTSQAPGSQTPTVQATPAPAATQADTNAATTNSQTPATSQASATPPRKRFQPIQLGAIGSGTDTETIDESKIDSVMDALKPLQVLLGRWKGNARKALLDQPEWMWDLTTDPKQPALVIKSPTGKYIREGRLTFLVKDQSYQLTTTDADGVTRNWLGSFTKEVQDVAGDDDKLQRTYKLEFLEKAAEPADEIWKLALSQQDNNRYLIELDRQRGSGTYVRVDTINTQREGTSFALNDSDYGEKECIVSQGLGTTSVAYLGQTYWVCCSGCKSAFEADPVRWLAKLAERKKMDPAKTN
ncbi:hypothetical protein Plim_0284 [Planctopirus limnophila DSM 3776]|uniref:YHS domain protein n=1 Tax=Planctopirus limnophila (strain ATCC 43296 / DSM 3776 / IFAM 1008 / Mu 290) TaxID=521674 RepID=D5SNY0_PLAL2|nr:hypothetical protein [Planctopirus limnophila]ADG66135.1 hypothetical protein Plim_0284 [Planctopirus limnophila DSM 3776]